MPASEGEESFRMCGDVRPLGLLGELSNFRAEWLGTYPKLGPCNLASAGHLSKCYLTERWADPDARDRSVRTWVRSGVQCSGLAEID
jgi:hypothetical protein